MSNNKETELDKQDSAEVKNYTRTPNMLIFGYHDTISPQEKWLYVCLKHLCGKKGTRHLSLRYISEKTGISVGALSKSKDKKGNINEGMIKHLHDAGLIHAEIKQRNGKGNPLYHITITDVWGLNQEFFSKTRPNSEQDEDEENEPVRISDVPVRNSDKLARNSDKPVQISDEPVRKPLQYQDYIQDYNQDDNTNTRKQERESTASESDTPTVSPPSVGALTLPGKTEEFVEKLREWRIEDEQQGDAHVDIPPGSADGSDTLPGADMGDLPASGQDRPVATPTARPILEAREEITVSKKGRDNGQLANTPTPTPAQTTPPTSEQAARRFSGSDLGKKNTSTGLEEPNRGNPVEASQEALHQAASGLQLAPDALANIPTKQSSAYENHVQVRRQVGHDGITSLTFDDLMSKQEPAHEQNHGAEPPSGAMVGDDLLSIPPAQEAASPKSLAEPDMSGKWSHDKCVEYAEWCNKRRYTDKMREEQLKAAQSIHKNDGALTLEQFKQAYDERNDAWWQEHKGKLHVNDMKAKGASGIDRVHEMLQRIEDAATRSKPRQISAVPRVKVFSSYDDPNFRSDQDFYPVEGGSYATAVV